MVSNTNERAAHIQSEENVSSGMTSSQTAQSLYNARFMDHVNYPDYRYVIEHPTQIHEGVNPSCGDELVFSLVIQEGKDGLRRIEDAAYQGHGCAISQASADMMSDCIIDKTPEEALHLAGLFKRMITGDLEEKDDLSELEDAAMLQSISHMPARVKCAELAWTTLEEMLGITHTQDTSSSCSVPSHHR